MRSVETNAKTRQEAIKKALEELGAELHEVQIQILDEGSRGIFGFGARDVKVKLTLEKDVPTRRHRDQEREGGRERDGDRERPRGERDRGGRGGQERRERRPEQPRGERPPATREAKPPRPEREERPRQERGPRPDRVEQRPPRSERPPRAARSPEGAARPERPPRPERPARLEQPRGERPPRSERSERGPRPERSERPRPERTERPPRPRPEPQAERPDEASAPAGTAHDEERDFAPVSDARREEAAALLSEIVAKMGIEAQVSSNLTDDGRARLNIESADSAILIGRKGRNLQALQYLINRMMRPGESETTERYIVDVESYLDRRRESLEEMARHFAERAKETGRDVRVKPLSPQERRIIHLTLQDDPDVRTFSLGTSSVRTVVISPKNAVRDPDRPRRSRGGSGRRGGRGGPRPEGDVASPPEDEPVSLLDDELAPLPEEESVLLPDEEDFDGEQEMDDDDTEES